MKENNLVPWVFLFLASFFEVCWLMSLKYLDFSQILKIRWFHAEKGSISFSLLLPLICYIVFGLCNIYFFSEAIKKIPMAIAFGIWLSLALVITTIIDYFYFKIEYSTLQFFFLAIILICVLGLKMGNN